MTKRNNIVLFLLLIIPSFVIFRQFYLSGALSAGDAPHFFGNEIQELSREPSVWTNRGETLGGLDPRLFISPLIVLFGLLGNLGLTHDTIVRVLFYFPAHLLALAGALSLGRHLKLSPLSQALAAFLYAYNTYFILLIDGGQVGIALAYGLFPFGVLALIHLFEAYSHKRFIIALIVMQAMMIADPRLALIAAMTILVLGLSGLFKNRTSNTLKQNTKTSLALTVALIGLNAYFLYPLMTIKGVAVSTEVSDLKFASLLNGLTLYQPHWPENVYGVVTQPSLLFWLLSVFILSGLFIHIKAKLYYQILLVFLVFVFLVKGTNAPLGELYSLFITKLPFGSAFRDSSKFFVPLMLLGGLLVGIVADQLQLRVSKSKITIGIALLMIAMVLPSIEQYHQFVLGSPRDQTPYNEFARLSEQTDTFARSAWFPERHTFAYETENKPALDAKSLAEIRPLADLTVGTADRFNYFSQSDIFLKWYQIFGVKYLIFSGDQRNPTPDSESVESWNQLLTSVDDVEGLQKEATELPIYSLAEAYPQIVGYGSLYLVVGAMLEGDAQTIPALYVEDGTFDFEFLKGVDATSVKILLNNTDKDDFTMSLLHEYYQKAAKHSEWATFGTGDYLTSKYQLLIRGIDEREFDYGLGIYFSDTASETLEYEVVVPEPSDYVLAIRSMGNDTSEISYTLNGKEETIEHNCTALDDEDKCRANFQWFTKGVSLPKGKHSITLLNKNGVSVVNTIALVPVAAWNVAQTTTNQLLDNYEIVDMESVETQMLYMPIQTNKRYAWWYDIESIPENVHWLVLSERFNPHWNLKRGVEYFPAASVYGTLNAFYVDSNYKDVSIRFRGQEQFRWGVYYSAITFIGLSLFFVYVGKPPRKNP